MFGTFVLGIAAGFLTPMAEPHIKGALQGVLLDAVKVEATELRLMSFTIVLFAAALVTAVVAVPNAPMLTLGALLGVFAPRLIERWKASKEPDYDS